VVRAPEKISDLFVSAENAQMLAPIEKTADFYATFEVRI
jgi:hypothetical protein